MHRHSSNGRGEFAAEIPCITRIQRHTWRFRVWRQSAIDREAHRTRLLRERDHVVGVVIIGGPLLGNAAAICIVGLVHKHDELIMSDVRELPRHEIGKGFHVPWWARQRIVHPRHESAHQGGSEHQTGGQDQDEALPLPALQVAKFGDRNHAQVLIIPRIVQRALRFSSARISM